MLRLALVIPVFFLGCASPLPNPSIDADAASSAKMKVRADEPSAVDPLAANAAFDPYAASNQAPPPKAPRRIRERFTLKGGYLSANDDGFDDGFIINAAWMRPISGLVSSELEIGYMDASGSDNHFDRDVWGIPFLANGRINVPVGEKIEVYGGLGLGWFYYNADADAPGVSVSGDGFLFAGDAYFGGDILLGESFYLGLEGKYYATENNSDLGGGLDSYVALLTLGFAR